MSISDAHKVERIRHFSATRLRRIVRSANDDAQGVVVFGAGIFDRGAALAAAN